MHNASGVKFAIAKFCIELSSDKLGSDSSLSTGFTGSSFVVDVVLHSSCLVGLFALSLLQSSGSCVVG